jgi:hypothetical protein
MRFEVVQAPDWAGIAREFSQTVGGLLVRAAVEMIMDNTDRIKTGKTLSGGPQKKNSRRWRKHKLRVKGHEIPLVFEGDMSDPSQWLINNQPASNYVGAFARREARWPGRARSHALRVFPQFVSVRFPPSRVEVAISVAQLGYDVPFGVTPAVEAIIREVGEVEMRTTVELATFGFRAIFEEA